MYRWIAQPHHTILTSRDPSYNSKKLNGWINVDEKGRDDFNDIDSTGCRERVSVVMVVHRQNVPCIILLNSPDPDNHDDPKWGGYGLPSWELTSPQMEKSGIRNVYNRNEGATGIPESINELRKILIEHMSRWIENSPLAPEDPAFMDKINRLMDIAVGGCGPSLRAESSNLMIGDYLGSLWKTAKNLPLVPMLPASVSKPYAVYHLFLTTIFNPHILPLPRNHRIIMVPIEDIDLLPIRTFPYGLRGLPHMLSKYQLANLTYTTPIPSSLANGTKSPIYIGLDEFPVVDHVSRDGDQE